LAIVAFLVCAACASCHRAAPATVGELLAGAANPEALPLAATDDGHPFQPRLRENLLTQPVLPPLPR
jgi:hypothetical protein